MLDERLKQEGRIVEPELHKVFLVDVWVEEDYDNLLFEWQKQENNKNKFIPLVLFFLLRSQKREVIRKLYDKRYTDESILPEWDCVPMYEELDLFVQNEGHYFEEHFGLSFDSLFDKDWRKIVDKDYCYCDFEMFPVTQFLLSPV